MKTIIVFAIIGLNGTPVMHAGDFRKLVICEEFLTLFRSSLAAEWRDPWVFSHLEFGCRVRIRLGKTQEL